LGSIFPSSFDGKVVLKKDPTVCLDGARTANSCIPPSQDASALTHPFDKLKIAKERVWSIHFLTTASSFQIYKNLGRVLLIRLCRTLNLTFLNTESSSLLATNKLNISNFRLCLQYGGIRTTLDASKTYKGMFDCIYKIAKYEGIRGLYKVKKHTWDVLETQKERTFDIFFDGLKNYCTSLTSNF